MSGSMAQFGMKKEATYGTAVAVDKFFEMTKEDIKGEYTRIQSEGLGATLVDRSDRFGVIRKGASGGMDMEVMTKNFGYWLEHMMGTFVGTADTPVVGANSWVATIGNLTGKGFTAQVGKPQQDGTIKPFTYPGGKITGFEFSNAVDQLLTVRLDMAFKEEVVTGTGPFALQAAQYPAIEVFTWAGGLITVGGTERDVYDCSVKVDNALKLDNYVIRKGAVKPEPKQDGKRKIDWSVRVPFTDMADFNRIAADTAAGAIASLVLQWEAATPITGTTYPMLKLEIPVARFDEGLPEVAGPSELETTLSGVGLYDGTNSALTITYVTSDTPPA
jgi:hypothetical protein